MTKGLEQVTEDEISRLSEVTFIEKGDKRIIFETEIDPNLLVNLRTVDDIGILVGKITKVTNVRQILDFLEKTNREVFQAEIKKFRVISDDISLTVSSARSSINSKELVQEVAAFIKENWALSFVEFEHGNFDLKIFIDGTVVFFSIRLTERSLHNRRYKSASLPGSLKPTVAAAMLQLATKFTVNNKIVDNFCGSGTMLCESVLSGNIVYGGDINAESVHVTKKNLENLRYEANANIKALDATSSGWQGKFFDTAISNLPWDKQIKIDSITELYEGTLREYSRILTSQGTLCALVGKPDLFVKYAKKYFPDKSVLQIKIGLLGQTPTIVLIA